MKRFLKKNYSLIILIFLSGFLSAKPIEIKSLIFNKSNILNRFELASIIGDVKGKDLTADSLERIISSVEKLYVQKGFPMSYARINGQKVKDGILQINLVDRTNVKLFPPKLKTSNILLGSAPSKITFLVDKNPEQQILIKIKNSSSYEISDELLLTENNWMNLKPLEINTSSVSDLKEPSFRLNLSVFNPENNRHVMLGSHQVNIIDHSFGHAQKSETINDQSNDNFIVMGTYKMRVPAFLTGNKEIPISKTQNTLIDSDICPEENLNKLNQVKHNFAPDLVLNVS